MKKQLYQNAQAAERIPTGVLDGSHAYRLKSWPEIPEPFRTARVLRACSRMTLGPVTANWFLGQTGLEPAEAVRLMGILIAQGTVDCIDLGPHTKHSVVTREALPGPQQRMRLRVRLAQRLAWKPAAVVALFCLAMAAAIDHGPVAPGEIALPDLPAVWG